MSNVNDVDERVLSQLSGSERIRLLLREAGFPTLSHYARKLETHVQSLSACLTGDRKYHVIRDALAEDLRLARSEVDEIIDGRHAA